MHKDNEKISQEIKTMIGRLGIKGAILYLNGDISSQYRTQLREIGVFEDQSICTSCLYKIAAMN